MNAPTKPVNLSTRALPDLSLLEISAVICVDADGKPVDVTPEERARLIEFGRGILVLSFNEEGRLEGKMAGEGLPPASAAGPRSAL